MANQNDSVAIDVRGSSSALISSKKRRGICFNETLLIASLIIIVLTLIWMYMVHSFYLNHVHDDDVRKEGKA